MSSTRTHTGLDFGFRKDEAESMELGAEG